LAAIYFNPGWTRLPSTAYRPFSSQGQMVTPFYWGNHLPLARRKPTGINIDDLAAMTPAHNAMMSWGHRRPQPLESRTAEMPDALGVTRKMLVEKWAWLIGLSDADDPRLLEWSRSFATPPKLTAAGARLGSPSYNVERRASLLTVESPEVTLTIEPVAACVNPVFELNGTVGKSLGVAMDGEPLPPDQYAWDGRTLWIDHTIRTQTELRLTFSP
jgi:hypothetical protein